MNKSTDLEIGNKKYSLWYQLFNWFEYWIKTLDSTPYKHATITIREMAEVITTLEKRLIALEQYCQKFYQDK
jgi:hypothetical protein